MRMIVWIMTIFSLPQYHTLQMLYISYPVSWGITFLIHFICYFAVRKHAEARMRSRGGITHES